MLILKQNSSTVPCLPLIFERRTEENVQKTADNKAEGKLHVEKLSNYAIRGNLKRSEYSKLYQLSFKMAENKF